jgi:hypothetical protein
VKIEYDENGRPKRESKKDVDYRWMLESSREAKEREDVAKFRISDREENQFAAWVNKVNEFNNLKW